jgi:SAM-dependent methyltransferase
VTFTPVAPVVRPRRARVTATALYDAALREHAAGLPAQLWVTCSLGTRPVPLARWCAASQACEPADVMALEAVLSTVPTGGAVLDLGCGPGRHTGYLADRGLAVVGVDTSRRAVAMTRARGARAVWGDGLGSLPTSPDGAGCWDAVLLLDGNIGIGGDPHRLLRRVRELLTPTGRLLVELDVDGVTAVGLARLDDGVRTSAAFPWARLSLRDLPETATATGLAVLQEWTTDDRAFAFLGQVPS